MKRLRESESSMLMAQPFSTPRPTHLAGGIILLALALSLPFSIPSRACAALAPPVAAQEGDVVQVHVTATLDDGTVVYTTRPEAAQDTAGKFSPDEVIAGKSKMVPGLGGAVVGMVAGESKKVTFPAEEAFGKPDPALRQELPCVRTIPRVVRLPADRFLQIAGAFPKEGAEVELVPYLKSRVAKVEDAAVVLEFSTEHGSIHEEEFGKVSIEVSEKEIVTRLVPKMGAPFAVDNKQGRIVSSDGKTFTVDFNPPQVGHALALDIDVLSILPAKSFADKSIEWEQEYAKALDLARAGNKPVVVVLYADWCQWCKRLFGESFEDPRIKQLSDQYVWLKINSDLEKKFKEQFQQKGFPMIVLLEADGRTRWAIEGFKDGDSLYRDLKSIRHPL